MSIKIMSEVWELTELSQPQTLVALALADHADEDGYCYPAIEKIAAKARLKRRRTQQIIADLEHLELLRIERGAGRRQTSRYWFTLDRYKGAKIAPFPKGAIDDEKRCTAPPEKVQSRARKGATASAPESSVTVIEPSGNRQGARARGSRPAIRLPDDFELTEPRRAFAVGEGIDPDREFAKFLDHWRAASGANARKRCWDAAWRNWCRYAVDRFGHQPARRGNGRGRYDDLFRED